MCRKASVVDEFMEGRRVVVLVDLDALQLHHFKLDQAVLKVFLSVLVLQPVCIPRYHSRDRQVKDER